MRIYTARLVKMILINSLSALIWTIKFSALMDDQTDGRMTVKSDK